MPKTTAALPRVEPIVPTLRPHPFNDPASLFEPKYDGYRGVFYLTRQGWYPTQSSLGITSDPAEATNRGLRIHPLSARDSARDEGLREGC
jgi:hypothetical protein